MSFFYDEKRIVKAENLMQLAKTITFARLHYFRQLSKRHFCPFLKRAWHSFELLPTTLLCC